MRVSSEPAWKRFSSAMLDWGGYVLLGVATALAVGAGGVGDPAWRLTTVALAVGAGLWIYLLYTRRPLPNSDHRIRLAVFFVGLLALASMLMLRHSLFFIFMIAGFFYATTLRPLRFAVAGIGATSVLVNTLIGGLPKTPAAWTFYLSIIAVQTVVISAGTVIGEKATEQSEGRRVALAELEAALQENAGLHAQLLTQARETGVLLERQRMAREIHDTIAQGLIGIITQLEAADHGRDRPTDRGRHLKNAKRLARESLTEARRSVEASMPASLQAGTLPEALRGIADGWSEVNSIPVDVTVSGDVVALHPEIEVALLRTAQEALANVAKHARATKVALTLTFLDDIVMIDIRDDGVGLAVDDAEPAPGSGRGFGIGGMRRRVARVAGSLAIESQPGGGTAVSARVPAVAAGSSPVVAP
jgi:signal transduction histidine kinase